MFTVEVTGRLTEQDTGRPLRVNSVVGFYRRVPGGYELIDYARVGADGRYAGEVRWNSSWPAMHLEESDWGCHYRLDTIAVHRRTRTYHHEHAIGLRESQCTRPHPLAVGAAMRIYDWLYRSVFRMRSATRIDQTAQLGGGALDVCDQVFCHRETAATSIPRELADFQHIEREIRERSASDITFVRALAERRRIQDRDGRSTRALLYLDEILAEERSSEIESTETAAETEAATDGL